MFQYTSKIFYKRSMNFYYNTRSTFLIYSFTYRHILRTIASYLLDFITFYKTPFTSLFVLKTFHLKTIPIMKLVFVPRKLIRREAIVHRSILINLFDFKPCPRLRSKLCYELINELTQPI